MKETSSLTTADKIIKYSSISLITLIILAMIIFLFIPRLSMAITGYGSYGVVSGSDSKIKNTDLKIVKNTPYKDLEKGDLIVFRLGSEYGEQKGIKVYTVMAMYGSGEDKYIHVHSTDQIMSFSWQVKEDMYIGTVESTIPVLGAFTGFLGSWIGITVIIVNLGIVGVIIYLVKTNKTEEKEEPAQ